MIVLSERDRNILRHIEEYKFATIKQISDMFFSEQKYGYDIARKRLNAMVQHNQLLVDRNYDNNQNVYSLEKLKKVTKSNLLLMDFYSKLIHEGIEIICFEKEYTGLMGGKIRPDAFVAIKIDNWILYLCVEVQTRHEGVDLEKYERFYTTNEFQDKFNVFPVIVVIDDIVHKKPLQSNRFKVVQLDFNLVGFTSIFLPQ